MTTKITAAVDVTEVMNRVCEALGKDFKIVYSRVEASSKFSHSHFEVTSEEFAPAVLNFSIDMSNLKAEIYVTWPKAHDGSLVGPRDYLGADAINELGGLPPTVGLTITRDPGVIAKNLRKNLIPKILPLIPHVLKGIADWKVLDESNFANFTEMMVSMGRDREYIESYKKNSRNGRSYPLSFSGFKNDKGGSSGTWVEFVIQASGRVDLSVEYKNPSDAINALNSIKA